ncbi:MAG: aldo/keto reductase [Actinomycetes bacterium]
MTLPTRPLGRTDMEISSVGFGAWAIGGPDWKFGWGAQDDDESVAAIVHAVECGVNWVDTAAVYGLGHSEEVVALALRDLPPQDRPYVFTKCGLVWDPADRQAAAMRVGDPASIRREVEQSLTRLRVERIDLLQMHWPVNDGTPVEDYWAAMLDLVTEGVIRAAGLSNHDVELLALAEKVGHVESLQPPFSAINRAVAAAELPWCAANDTGVIAYSPMQSGLLSGAFTEERAAGLPEDDWRAGHPNFTEPGLQRNLAVAEVMEQVALRHGVPTASVAVAWALAWPGVTGAIVGARRPDQVDGWLPAAGLTLTAEDLAEIAEVIERTGAGEGPVRPGD